MSYSSQELEQIARSQTRQQIVLVILCVLVAASTVATWRSATAIKEASSIQTAHPAKKSDASRKAAQTRPARSRSTAKSGGTPNRQNARDARDSGVGQHGTADKSRHGDREENRVVLLRQGRQ